MTRTTISSRNSLSDDLSSIESDYNTLIESNFSESQKATNLFNLSAHSLSKFYESEMENMSKKCQKRNLNLLDKNELQAILRNKVKRDGAVKVKIPEGRKVIAIGDTHGHYGFIQLLEIACKYLKLSNPFNPNTNEGTPAENMPIVFILGDMVDRGIYTVPNYCLAVYAEIRFPEHVFLLKGNHEDGREINSRYGKGWINSELGNFLRNNMTESYDWLSYFAIAKTAGVKSKSVLFCHGGPSEKMEKVIKHPSSENFRTFADRDVLWSDPASESTNGKYLFNRKRIAGKIYDLKCIKRIPSIDLCVKGHERPKDERAYEVKLDGNVFSLTGAYQYCGGRNDVSYYCLENNLEEIRDCIKVSNLNPLKIPEEHQVKTIPKMPIRMKTLSLYNNLNFQLV